jgi:hypothetical protein
MWPGLAASSSSPYCLFFPSAGITGMYHYAQPLEHFFHHIKPLRPRCSQLLSLSQTAGAASLSSVSVQVTFSKHFMPWFHTVCCLLENFLFCNNYRLTGNFKEWWSEVPCTFLLCPPAGTPYITIVEY